jgi:hypothetical protein
MRLTNWDAEARCRQLGERYRGQFRRRVPLNSISMSKQPVNIEVVQAGEERYLLKVFADGSEQRELILKSLRKKRYPNRPYWHWNFDKSKKKER